MEKTKRAKTGFWKKEIKTIIIKNLNFLYSKLSSTVKKLKVRVAMGECFAHYLLVDPVCSLCRSCLGDFGSALRTFQKNTSYGQLIFVLFLPFFGQLTFANEILHRDGGIMLKMYNYQNGTCSCGVKLRFSRICHFLYLVKVFVHIILDNCILQIYKA